MARENIREHESECDHPLWNDYATTVIQGKYADDCECPFCSAWRKRFWDWVAARKRYQYWSYWVRGNGDCI